MEKTQIKDELESVRQQQKNTIQNYCNSIGCKNCPLQEPDGNCHSTQLQDREYNLEERLNNL